MNCTEIEKELKEILTPERYLHTLGVKDCAVELAKRYGADVKKAEIAGLLHDCAKCMEKEVLKSFITKNIKDIQKNEMKNYKTLHAPVGANLVCTKYKINDKEIINAVRWHTLGRVNMGLLEKIIFLADKIEKNTIEMKF